MLLGSPLTESDGGFGGASWVTDCARCFGEAFCGWLITDCDACTGGASQPACLSTTDCGDRTGGALRPLTESEGGPGPPGSPTVPGASEKLCVAGLSPRVKTAPAVLRSLPVCQPPTVATAPAVLCDRSPKHRRGFLGHRLCPVLRRSFVWLVCHRE